jgi:hypothetical protein
MRDVSVPSTSNAIPASIDDGNTSDTVWVDLDQFLAKECGHVEDPYLLAGFDKLRAARKQGVDQGVKAQGRR